VLFVKDKGADHVNLKKIRINIVSSVLFLAFGVFLLLIPHVTGMAAGSALFPRIISVCILLLSVFLLAQNLPRLLKARAGGAQEGSAEEKAITLHGATDFLVPAIGIMLYIVCINVIGFYVTTSVFLFASMRLLGYKNLKVTILSTIGTVAFLYFLFHMQLRVPLPQGIFL